MARLVATDRAPLPDSREDGGECMACERGLIAIAVELEVAAKIAVLEAFNRSGISKSELGR